MLQIADYFFILIMIGVIGNKDGKSYKADLSEKLVGKKVGETIDGSLIGLEGYELLITGGSDKQGFPMRKDVEGQKRVKSMLSKKPGFKPKRKGERRRKNIRGKIIAEDVAQVNLKVIKAGKKKLEDVFKKEPEPEQKPEE